MPYDAYPLHRNLFVLAALSTWILSVVYVLPAARTFRAGMGMRRCEGVTHTIHSARLAYEERHGTPITVFDADTRQALVSENLLGGYTTWPDDPLEGKGTGDHYVLVPSIPDPHDPASPRIPGPYVACTRHGVPLAHGPVRQQFIDAGVTDPALLARCFPGHRMDFVANEPLDAFIHPIMGPFLLGCVLIILRPRRTPAAPA